MRDLATNERLMMHAIELFGRRGVDGVGTRALAQEAGVPMSAITYHFGGKEGLYLACARHIVSIMNARVGPLLGETETLCGPGGGPDEARTALLALLSGMTMVMLGEDVAPVARFVIREQMDPSAAFAIIYEGLMSRVIERVSDLVRAVSAKPLSNEEARLRTLAILGQVLVFRFARATLMSATRWTVVSPEQAQAVQAAVMDQAGAILDHLALRDLP